MKILKKIIIAIFIFFVIFSVGVAIFLKTFNVNAYKPKIIDEAKKAIGRDIGIGRLSLSWSFPLGVSVKADDLRIADNPRYSAEDFLTVKELILGVDILPFLIKRQIVISSTYVKSPRFILIKDESGQFNVQTFSIQAVSKDLSFSTKDFLPNLFEGEAFAATAQSAQNPPNLFVKSIRLEDGVVIFKDKTFDPLFEIKISQIRAAIDQLSLTRPFDFSIELALLSSKRNVSAQGMAQVDLEKESIVFRDVRANGDLSQISVDLVKQSFPMLGNLELKEEMKGKFQLGIKEMIVGSKGLSALQFEGMLDKGRLALKQLPLSLDQIHADIQGTESDMTLQDFSLNLGSGKIEARGKVLDYLKGQEFHGQAKASGIDLGEVLPQDQPMQFQGKLFAEFELEKAASYESQDILRALAGKGSVEIREGKLVGANILRIVLDKMSMLPGLVEAVEANLPENYREALKSEDTIFKEIRLDTRVKNGALFIDTADVITDAFRLSGKGKVSFSQELDLEAAIAIPQDLSRIMVSSVEGLEYLLDNSGEIVIPVRVAGKIPALVFVPDLEYLGKRILMNRGRQELEKVLDKVFGAPNEEAGSSPPSSPQTSGEPQEKSPEEELIGTILDKIFR